MNFPAAFNRNRISRGVVVVLLSTLFNSVFVPIEFSTPAHSAPFGSANCSSDFTGGTVVEVSLANYCVFRVTAGTTVWIPPVNVSNFYLLTVGGGGGGANNAGGGGGGGAISYGWFAKSSATSFSITVGSGGAGGTNPTNGTSNTLMDGGNGEASTVTATGSSLNVQASGGSGGQTRWNNNICGGSGNPAVTNAPGGTVGSSSGLTSITSASGAAGGAWPATSSSGAGGAGVAGTSINITGTPITFGNSGGRGAWGSSTAGAGVSGGGAGGASGTAGSAGTANTGSGGGGGGDGCANGGAGSSGIVIIKWIPAPILNNPSTFSNFPNRAATSSYSDASSTTLTVTRQWQLSTNSGSSWIDVSAGSGGTTTTYTTPTLTSGDSSNLYRASTTYSDGVISSIGYSTSATVSFQTMPGSDTDTALTLNGTSQYAEVVDSADSLFDITGNITLEAWVFPTSSCTSDQGIISKFNSYMLYCGGGAWKYVFDADGASWSGTGTTIAIRQNEWQHVAFVKSSTTLFIYINGQLLATITGQPSTMSANNGAFSIGRYGSGNYFQGRIDEVRVYNTARTQADIQSDMNTYGSVTDSNLRAYFDFNEGSGNTLYNRTSGSSTSSDLTVVGLPSWPENITASTSQAYTIRTFTRSYLTSSGGWKVPAGVTRVSALVVAGGGGGGSDEGGGGGGGGFLESTLTSLNSSHLTVQVGQGGLGAYGGDELTKGANGQNSVFSSLTAIGGGGGGSSVNRTSTLRNGSSGGSGGGGAGENYTNRLGGSGTPGQGFDGGAGGAASSTARGGGGGGAGQAGTVGGAGGAGKASTITGTSVTYAGGGGGGHGNSTSGSGAAGGSGGGGTGGDYNTANSRGSANTGGGGGGGCGNFACGDWNEPYSGASGGSGVIIIRWITASAPTFTAPVAVDTTTAGTRYTFRVSGSATSPLIRNYQWQFSSNSGSTWTTQQSSTSDSFTTSTLETTTSGITNLYRVIVTDSDTAGLSISDSRTSYLVINPRITITVDTSTITRDYGVATVKTFTFANGTGPRVATASPGNQSGITWSNLNSDSATLTLAPTLTAGSYSDTITVTDSVTATTSLRLTITINKARQASLSIGQYNAFPGVSTYPINVYGGSGSGAVTRSRLSAGSANCTLTSEMFLTATSPGTCSVQAVKAGDTNYLSETATATIYWIQWSDAYATRAPSTPTEIVLNHSTAITKYNYDTLTVTSYQNSSGVTITSIATGATLRIIGDGFDPASAYTEVVFASMDALDLTSGLQVISSGGSNYLQLTVPSGVTTGAITVNSPKGTAVGPTLTITP